MRLSTIIQTKDHFLIDKENQVHYMNMNMIYCFKEFNIKMTERNNKN